MNWLYYLLEANLYLAVFYGFYRLLLHRETFYSLNRYYLLSATLLAFVLPLIQVGYLQVLLSETQESVSIYVKSRSGTKNPIVNSQTLALSWLNIIYVSAAMILLLRLILNLSKVIRLAWTSPKERHAGIIYVKFEGIETAFSFFNFLFLNPKIEKKDTVIRHELVHIHQKHSADVLFFEMLQVLNWFNPLVWMIKKDVQLLHEYIADENSTDSGSMKHEYAMFLIQNSFGRLTNGVTSQIFNQSILKMRINMLNKKRSADGAKLRLLLVLPLSGAMLCASTLAFSKDYVTIDLYSSTTESRTMALQDTLKKKPVVRKTVPIPKKTTPPAPKVTTVKFPPPVVTKDKVPPAPKLEQVKFPPPMVKKNKIAPPPPPVEPKESTPKEPDTPTPNSSDKIVSELRKDGILKDGIRSLEFNMLGTLVIINGEKQTEAISKKYAYLLNLKEGEEFALDFVDKK